jgi:hypothetical protein
MSKRPDVILRNKSQKQRDAVVKSWKNPDVRSDRILNSAKHVPGFTGYWKGKHRIHSQEWRQKHSEALKGKTTWFNSVSKDDPKRVEMSRKSGETRKIRGSQSGKNHWTYGKGFPKARETIIATMRSGKMYGGKEGTKPERKMKELLDQLGVEYIFQYPIGKYLCDFYVPSRNLVIEVDGEYWHNYPDGREVDKTKDGYLKGNGYKVIRLWASDVLKMKVFQS